jgi:hypothetical protein
MMKRLCCTADTAGSLFVTACGDTAVTPPDTEVEPTAPLKQKQMKAFSRAQP